MNTKQLLDDMREIAESDVAKHADELIEQWAQTWNAFQPVATAQVQAPVPVFNPFKYVQNPPRTPSQGAEQQADASGPGDGVTTCKDCGYKLTELFMSKACDRCDGLLKPEPVKEDTDEIAYTLMFERAVRGLRRVDLTGYFSSSSWADIETFAKRFPGSHLVVLKHNKSNSHRIHAIWTEDARRDTSDVLIHDMVTI